MLRQGRSWRYSGGIRTCIPARSATTVVPPHSIHRRRKRRLKTRPLPPTLRERLRFFPETLHNHQRQHHGKKSLVERGSELLDVAESRIGWFRNKVFSFWNSDYTAESSSSSSSSTSTQPSSSTRSGPHASSEGGSLTSGIVLQERMKIFKHTELVMDFRWWVWNIAFALLPAGIIFFYCELFGKHAMYAYHQKMELAHMKQVMGEAWCEQHAAHILQVQKDRDADLSDRIFAKLYRDVSSLTRQQVYTIYALITGRNPPLDDTRPSDHPVLLGNSEQVNPSSSRPPQSNDDTMLDYTGDDKTIHALIRKVRELESKLLEHEQQQQQPSPLGDATTRSIDDRIRRVHQSGIGNRVEDDAVRKWEKILAEKSNQANDNKNETSSFVALVSTFLSRQFSTIVDQLKASFHNHTDGGSSKDDEDKNETPVSNNNNNSSCPPERPPVVTTDTGRVR